jgi:hypothetical protein
MLRIPGGPQSPAQGAASTTQMTDVIIAKLGLRAKEALSVSSGRVGH